ncbi:dihydrofolate reductase family protein [Microbacterium sp.]|uniref:dihydrofolate reductase family protein n=1 Tax=Microbacterium sp. TaxID=51671 RepID=UPI002811D8C5|nr:dihydrofolate reductase family protein [Microbacterium sp.]
MGRIVATENITLDGVIQGPGGTDEDTRGGFQHGGWASGFDDPVTAEFMGADMSTTKAMLFGRRTYDQLVGHWLSTTDPNPFTGLLAAMPKYVCSASASTKLPHPNSTLLAGDAAETVARLKEEVDGPISVLGSGMLVRSLLAADLLDGLVLVTFPIVLGSGTKLFADSARVDLSLERSARSSTGLLLAEYSVRALPG